MLSIPKVNWQGLPKLLGILGFWLFIGQKTKSHEILIYI